MKEKEEGLLDRLGRYGGPAAFVLALAVYLLTLSRGASPGSSARLIVQHVGLDPFVPLSSMVWGWVARLVSALPIGSLAFRLNLLSALCGAAAVGLLFVLAARVPHDRTIEEVESRVPTRSSQVLTGLVGAMFLAFCVPFWVVSTRAHTASFDVLLLLFTTWLLVRFAETRRWPVALLFALAYGIGIVESYAFIVLSPVFFLWVVLVLWRAERLRTLSLLQMAGCCAAGLLLYVVAAVEYRLRPVAAWRAFDTMWQVVWFMWRDQYRAIRFGIPQVGWLLVFLVCILPAVIVVVAPKRAPTRAAVKGSYFLHAVLSVLGLSLLFNFFLTPWRLLGQRVVLVVPYLLVGLWLGYLAGYWHLLLSRWSRFDPPWQIRMKQIGRRGYVPALVVLLLAAAVLNLRWADGRPGQTVNRLAGEIVDSLEGRRWLVSSGSLDPLVLLAARERGVPLTLLNTEQGQSGAYLRYVASLFDDPRLKGLAQIGITPLLTEWLTSQPEAYRKVAVFGNADAWFSAGYTPVPNRTLYVGVTNAADVDAEELFRKHKRFWADYGAAARDAASLGGPLQDWNQWALTHVSKLANDTGVFLEDQGRSDLAWAAYREARVLDARNVSAMLNILSLAQRESRPEAAELTAEFEDFVSKMKGRLGIWSLSYRYGYVRDPEAFARRGIAWAMSGKPNLAVAEMQRAVALGADRQRVEMAVASFYSMQQMDSESEKLYLGLLDQNPNNTGALLGLAALATRKGDFDSARGYVGRLRELGMSESSLRLEEAVIDALSGEAAAALQNLQELTKAEPKNLRAWVALAVVAAEVNDQKVLDRCVAVLTSAASRSPSVLMTLAQIAMSRNKLQEAAGHLEELLRVQPSNEQALEWLVEIDMRSAQRTQLEDHVEQLLQINSRNALANLVLGKMQYAREQYELAEASFRASLATRRTSETLNDLAWILQMKGRYEEALQTVTAALEMNQGHASAWDTRGVILMRLGRLDDALASLQRALAIVPGHPPYVLHMAQVYEKKGMRQEALRLADPLLARATELQPSAYEELRALVRRLQSGPRG